MCQAVNIKCLIIKIHDKYKTHFLKNNNHTLHNTSRKYTLNQYQLPGANSYLVVLFRSFMEWGTNEFFKTVEFAAGNSVPSSRWQKVIL